MLDSHVRDWPSGRGDWTMVVAPGLVLVVDQQVRGVSQDRVLDHTHVFSGARGGEGWPQGVRVSSVGVILYPFLPTPTAGAHCESRIVGCLFNSSDTKQWTYIDQQAYDGELIVFFDFDQRKYVAAKDWMQSNVDRWNKDGSAESTYQGAISMCENNIPIDESEVLPRRGERGKGGEMSWGDGPTMGMGFPWNSHNQGVGEASAAGDGAGKQLQITILII